MAKFAESGKLTAKKDPRNGTVGAEWVGWEDRGENIWGGGTRIFRISWRVFFGSKAKPFSTMVWE